MDLRESNVPQPEAFRFASLHIGGVPSSYLTNLGKMSTSEGFIGCISDVAFNGILVNFANSSVSSSAFIGKCEDPDLDPLQSKNYLSNLEE